jgi:malonyl-CoA O-methyltransferase
MNKTAIKQRFDAASQTYDGVAGIQKQCAEQLVITLMALCPDFYPDSVLDLGTGTGYLPELLLPKFPQTRFTLNDLSPRMLARSQAKFEGNPQVTGQLGDMETTSFNAHALTISNLALQWMNDLDATLQTFYLNSEVLAFTCLLEGTFQAWEGMLEQSGLLERLPSYPSRSQLETSLLALKPVDYSFTAADFTMTFSSPLLFMRYLQRLGASYALKRLSFAEVKRLMRVSDGPFEVTYCVFFGVLKR